MKHDLIDELQAQIDTLWAKAELGEAITLSRVRLDDGSTHVEIVAGRLDIVGTERGRETMRKASLSLTEASHFYLFDMAVWHAQQRELRERKPPENAPLIRNGATDDGYSRWNWMAPAIETMGRIDPDLGDWAMRYYSKAIRNSQLSDYEKRNAKWPLPPML
ncbi:MAG: hypothetical protein ABJN34_02055 [Litoreibacter sp.]|uniref:hypothetical protein n=1 Tax=Litoreibacter sp. TaxID=1969459 RepID=UPI003297CDC4